MSKIQRDTGLPLGDGEDVEAKENSNEDEHGIETTMVDHGLVRQTSGSTSSNTNNAGTEKPSSGQNSSEEEEIDDIEEGQQSFNKSVRFQPALQYSKRDIFSGRQVYKKAQSVRALEVEAKDGVSNNINNLNENNAVAQNLANRNLSSFSSSSNSYFNSTRECYVQVVSGLKEAMDPKQRRRKEFGKRRKDGSEQGTKLGPETQYRLISIGGPQSHVREQQSFDPAKRTLLNNLGFNAYVYWSYKTTFLKLFLSLTVVFYVLVTFFAALIYTAGSIQPKCLYVGSLDFQTAGDYFMDAFAISWTTFSTVGYGLTGPSLSNVDRCILLNMFTAIEAFLGVLFAGAAGAIILGKIMRYNAIAPLVWSDPVVLRYGKGVEVEERGELQQKEDDDCENAPIPYPVLEFRVANEANARDGGEIANAQIQVWARILACNATQELMDAARMASMSHQRRRKHRREQQQLQQLQQVKLQSKCNVPKVGKMLKKVGGKATAVTKKVGGVGKQVTKKVGGVGKQVGGSVSTVGKTLGGSVVNVGRRVSTAGKTLLSPLNAKDASSADDTSMVSSDFDDRFSNPDDFFLDPISSHVMDPRIVEEMEEMLLMNSVAVGVGKANPTIATEAALLPSALTGVVLMDEGDPNNDSGLAVPTIYSRLSLENESHPFFKRIWHLRHRLDDQSPLLDASGHKILRQFRANGGQGWPPELNSHEKLREHVCFEEISVTLSGTDHITGNTVYGQTVYNCFDLVIGYRFANVLTKNNSIDNIGVDVALINDVLEQHGGGGEPLMDDDCSDSECDPPVGIVDIYTDIENQITDASELDPIKED